jgi:hypothetical protein
MSYPMATTQLIADREDALYQAMITLDYAALDDLLSDAVSYIHSTGAVESKTAYLAGLRDGMYEYGAIARISGKTMLYPSVAVTTGVIEMCVGATGLAKNVIQLQHVLIWREEATVWRLLLRHATRVPATPTREPSGSAP